LQPGKFARPASASLLTALFLFLSFVGSSPQLHKLIHADANAPDHSCAITLFAHGQVAAADVTTAIVTLLTLVVVTALLAETFLLPQADYRYSPSRAPPVFKA
jgi:L-fucose mutarotase/ribose pyranase (RbsD/FucU family)